MLSQKLQDAINEQMKNEFFSAYLYKAMAAWFEAEDLPGFAHWMRLQTLEELCHGEKFFNFICEAGGRAIMLPIDGPQTDYESPQAVFEYSLKHEQFVTDRINQLMTLAKQENNHAAEIFLQWFVTEQVEEEDSVNDLLHKLRLVNGEGQGMLLLDKDLAARVFTMPAATA